MHQAANGTKVAYVFHQQHVSYQQHQQHQGNKNCLYLRYAVVAPRSRAAHIRSCYQLTNSVPFQTQPAASMEAVQLRRPKPSAATHYIRRSLTGGALITRAQITDHTGPVCRVAAAAAAAAPAPVTQRTAAPPRPRHILFKWNTPPRHMHASLQPDSNILHECMHKIAATTKWRSNQ